MRLLWGDSHNDARKPFLFMLSYSYISEPTSLDTQIRALPEATTLADTIAGCEGGSVVEPDIALQRTW